MIRKKKGLAIILQITKPRHLPKIRRNGKLYFISPSSGFGGSAHAKTERKIMGTMLIQNPTPLLLSDRCLVRITSDASAANADETPTKAKALAIIIILMLFNMGSLAHLVARAIKAVMIMTQPNVTTLAIEKTLMLVSNVGRLRTWVLSLKSQKIRVMK